MSRSGSVDWRERALPTIDANRDLAAVYESMLPRCDTPVPRHACSGHGSLKGRSRRARRPIARGLPIYEILLISGFSILRLVVSVFLIFLPLTACIESRYDPLARSRLPIHLSGIDVRANRKLQECSGRGVCSKSCSSLLAAAPFLIWSAARRKPRVSDRNHRPTLEHGLGADSMISATYSMRGMP